MSDARIAILEQKVELLTQIIENHAKIFDAQGNINDNLIKGLQSANSSIGLIVEGQTEQVVKTFAAELDQADKCGKHCACGGH